MNADKKISFIFTGCLVFVLVFTTALTCNLCGKKIDINDENDIVQETAGSEEASTDGQELPEDTPGSGTEKDNGSNIGETTQDVGGEKELVPGEGNQQAGQQEERLPLLDDRFVLIIETMDNRGTEYSYANGNDPNFYETGDYFTNNLKIPQEQQYIFWGQDGQGGTYDNFLFAVDRIKRTSTTDCTVIVFLMSHGSPKDEEGGFPALIEFADGMGNEHGGACKTYEEISSFLDEIPCAGMFVTVSSCALTDSVEPLTSNPAFPRAAMAPITMQEILNYIITDSVKVDMDKNGNVSIRDVYDFVKDPEMTSNPARYEGMLFRDEFGISEDIYLN